MKYLLLLAVLALPLAGCQAVGPEYYTLHEDVFGCPPVGMEDCAPKRELEAVGPRESDCGKPVYVKPDCPSCKIDD